MSLFPFCSADRKPVRVKDPAAGVYPGDVDVAVGTVTCIGVKGYPKGISRHGTGRGALPPLVVGDGDPGRIKNQSLRSDPRTADLRRKASPRRKLPGYQVV